MENSLGRLIIIMMFSSLIHLASFSRSVEAYRNYTVGDSLGWFDNTQKPDVDYQKWVSAYNFSLGDFLIFNSDTNHTVIQTYNETTYKLCNYEDSSDNETITIQWSSADPSNTAIQPVSVAVPLLKQGTTYFFSSDYDGDQCNNGQHFEINVSHGKGLPKALQEQYFPNSPQSSSSSSTSPGPVSAQSGDGDGNGEDESAPDTIVPSSFSHPHKVESDEADDNDDDDSKKSSASVSLMSFNLLGWRIFGGIFMGFGLVSLF